MMRALLLWVWSGAALSAEPAAAEFATRIAVVEIRLPWLWSPSLEGLADVPHTTGRR